MKWEIYSSCYGSAPIIDRKTFSDNNDPFARTELSTTRRARLAKLTGWKYVDADVAVYCDSAIRTLPSIAELVERFYESNMTFGVFRHIAYDCVYEEANMVLSMGLDVELTVLPQMQRYRDESHPMWWGLFETGLCMFRTSRADKFSQVWWNEIEQGSHRDQLSLPPVLRRLNVPVYSFGRDLRKCPHLVFEKKEISERHGKKSRRIGWL